MVVLVPLLDGEFSYLTDLLQRGNKVVVTHDRQGVEHVHGLQWETHTCVKHTLHIHTLVLNTHFTYTHFC